MNTTDTPTTPPAAAAAVMMPGRIVDVVHAAMASLDMPPFSIGVEFTKGATPCEVRVHGSDDTTEAAARELFAVLGTTDPVLGSPFGDEKRRLALLAGDVPALGIHLMVTVYPPAAPAPAVDLTALIADVDARRAQATNNDPAAQPGTTPAPAPGRPAARPAVTAVTAGGERAARFEARFDSVCPACRQALLEGAPASWLDGEAVHDACAQAAGITVYDPH